MGIKNSPSAVETSDDIIVVRCVPSKWLLIILYQYLQKFFFIDQRSLMIITRMSFSLAFLSCVAEEKDGVDSAFPLVCGWRHHAREHQPFSAVAGEL